MGAKAYPESITGTGSRLCRIYESLIKSRYNRIERRASCYAAGSGGVSSPSPPRSTFLTTT